MNKEVISALIRVVLKIEERTNNDNHEWFDIATASDCSLLREALKREEEQGCIHSGKEWIGKGKCPFCEARRDV